MVLLACALAFIVGLPAAQLVGMACAAAVGNGGVGGAAPDDAPVVADADEKREVEQ